MLPAALRTALPAATLAITAGVAAAQPANFFESLEVRVVNLEVYVTDRQGNPIGGLTAKDFTILEDGKRVPLSNFSYVEGRGADGSEDGDPAATAPQGVILLLFDNQAIDAQGREAILDALRRLFAEGAPEDLLWAVASYQGYLELEQGPTRDLEAVLAAVERSGRLTPLGALRQAEREGVLRQGLETLRTVSQMARDEDRLPEATRKLRNFSRQIDAEAESQRQLTRAAVFELSHLMGALAALPGRKAVLYFGEGMPERPGEELYAAVDQLFARVGNSLVDFDTTDSEERDAVLDMRSDALGSLDPGARARRQRGEPPTGGFQELAALANAARVSFYPLKADLGQGGLPPEFVGEMRDLFTPQLQGIRERNLSGSLRSLAEETGGRFAFGSDVAAHLAAARADLEGYYYLGFRPRRPADGAFHKLKVKVRGRGLELRHRSGYVDKPAEAKLADRTTAALLLGVDDNPLGVELELGAPAAAPQEGLWVVPADVTIPLDALAGHAPGRKVAGALLVAARDPEGRMAPVQQLPLELDPAAASRFTARFQLLMRGGGQRLAVGVVIPAAGAAAFVSRELEVASGG